TSDNPRSEDPGKILDMVCVAFDGMQNKEFHRIADRRVAIEFVMSQAKAGDVVMIAGKGHENYQILKDRTIHFDDKEIVEEYFRNVKCR
ncbi:MAG: UDP-N-acetylmuramoyl-L-alanyl-D-glutamate--2,6-diaminopimelate ligase, partial [Phascolarctobacterium sp.]|nr:UDP-N-acetylmuramoyl-L-alanyl-D-glutamate--2,6-diaminopimelate ligase [Candidatus Phascolarctobacterium equi]